MRQCDNATMRRDHSHHSRDVQQGPEARICSLILGHALDSSLFNLELASEALSSCVEAAAILKALAWDSAIVGHIRGTLRGRHISYACLDRVLLQVIAVL